MQKRLLIIPRWSGGSTDDWYPWFQQSLKQNSTQIFNSIQALDMPQPNEPVLAVWRSKIIEQMGSDPAEIARTVLVGHSVGCLAILHYLAQLQPGLAVDGIFCVAGWLEVDHPWPSLKRWSDAPLEATRVKAAAKKRIVLISDNDPFNADPIANKQMWEERMDAIVSIVPGAQHFNRAEEPAVLNKFIAYFA